MTDPGKEGQVKHHGFGLTYEYFICYWGDTRACSGKHGLSPEPCLINDCLTFFPETRWHHLLLPGCKAEV